MANTNNKVDLIEKVFSEINLVSTKLYEVVSSGETDNSYIEPYKNI